MAGETILVVDDAKATRDFAVDCVLKPHGYKPLTAVDGEDGLRVALEALPDLIILDLEMPRLNGLQVLQALRRRALSIPVILSTAHGSEGIAIEVFRLGVRDYVTKPYEVDEMLAAIERALTETRVRHERDDLMARLVQTNRSLEARLRELGTLYGIGKSVTTLLNHGILLRRIVEAAQFVTGAQACILRLKEPSTGQLHAQAMIDPRDTLQVAIGARDTSQPDSPLARQVMRTGQAAITATAVAVPLQVGSKIIGTLDISTVGGGRQLTDHDMHLLQALADYAAIAIENSRLFRELEESKEREKQTIRNVFEHYVTPSVVEQLLSRPDTVALGGARRTITTLFADLRGFTALSEKLKPEALFEALNHHLSLGAEVVLNYEGTLDKFMGDAIMAFFNAPLPQTDYAVRAVLAGVDIQRRISATSQLLAQLHRLQFGIGISTGEAIVGNIGTAQLMNYTAIGSSVNLARRLQESAKGGQILIDQTTFEAVNTRVRARALGLLEVKGMRDPIPVFEVLGLR